MIICLYSINLLTFTEIIYCKLYKLDIINCKHKYFLVEEEAFFPCLRFL